MTNLITVKTSARLDVKSVARIKDFVKTTYKVTAGVEQIIDKSLVAGFIININGIEHDYSLSGELARLSQAI